MLQVKSNVSILDLLHNVGRGVSVYQAPEGCWERLLGEDLDSDDGRVFDDDDESKIEVGARVVTWQGWRRKDSWLARSGTRAKG